MQQLKRLANLILDTIFPIECLGCKSEGEWLCKRCAEQIPIVQNNACFVCKNSAQDGRICFPCRKECTLAGVINFFDYDDQLVRAALKIAKYGFVKTALFPLLDIIKTHALSKMEFFDIDPRAAIFVPVPLHPRRFRERGFNQAQLIADAFASATGGAVLSALTRRGFRPPQASLDACDRVRNIYGAFVCRNPETIRGKYIFLVDDVATTGATLDSCGKALKLAGAREAWGMVLAKG